jgi:hypothetical protein
VTELLTGIPKLTISATNQTLQLTWTGTLFTLQKTTSLPDGSWSTVTAGATTNQGVVTVTLPISNGSALFRLQVP